MIHHQGALYSAWLKITRILVIFSQALYKGPWWWWWWWWYLFTAIGLSPGGRGYFTRIQNMKLVTNKFKMGGLHEKHVVATWNVGNHLSICLQTQGNQEKPVSRWPKICVDDEFSVIGNMLEHFFKYFIILIASTHYILCISWIIKC